jgi:hypothetical protein
MEDALVMHRIGKGLRQRFSVILVHIGDDDTRGIHYRTLFD